MKNNKFFVLVATLLFGPTVSYASEVQETIENIPFTFSNFDNEFKTNSLNKKILSKKRNRSTSLNAYLETLEHPENLRCPKCQTVVMDNPLNFICKGTVKGGHYDGNQLLKCRTCNRIFHKDTVDHLEEYLKTLTNPEDLKCPGCKTRVIDKLKNFNDFFILNGSKKSKDHEKKQNFFCKKCKCNFTKDSSDDRKARISLNEHLETLEHPEDLKCPKCSSTEISLHGFILSGNHIGERRYECRKCKKNFFAYNKNNMPKFNNNMLSSLQQLKNPENFKCPKCNTLVKDNIENFILKGLVKSGAYKGKQQFFCKKCNCKFYEIIPDIPVKSRHTLEQYLNQIENSETLQCEKCKKNIKDNIDSFNIIGGYTSIDGNKHYRCHCKSCDTVFYLNPRLKSLPEGLKCPKCSNETNFGKSGIRKGIQHYLCKNCNYDFVPGGVPTSYGRPLPPGLACSNCYSQDNIIRKGFIDPETKKIPKYYCKDCNVYFSKETAAILSTDNDNVKEHIPSHASSKKSVLFNKLACPHCNAFDVVKYSLYKSSVYLRCNQCKKSFNKPIIPTFCYNCMLSGRIIATNNEKNPYICATCGGFDIEPLKKYDPFYLKGLSIHPKSQMSESFFNFQNYCARNNSKCTEKPIFDQEMISNI